jgi:hypothetical protein
VQRNTTDAGTGAIVSDRLVRKRANLRVADSYDTHSFEAEAEAVAMELSMLPLLQVPESLAAKSESGAPFCVLPRAWKSAPAPPPSIRPFYFRQNRAKMQTKPPLNSSLWSLVRRLKQL